MEQQQSCAEYQYFTVALLPWICDGLLEEIGFFHLKRKKLEKIWISLKMDE